MKYKYEEPEMKQKYKEPELIRHGTIEELTQGNGEGDVDVGYGSQEW